MKILVAYDGSEYSKQMLEVVRKLPLKPNAQILICHANMPIIADPDHADEQTLRSFEDFNAKQKQRTHALLADAKSKLESLPYSINTLSIDGEPSSVLLSVAEQNNIDLMVVGARGLNPIQTFLLGSVSNKLLLYAKCSVLVCKGNIKNSSAVEALACYDDSPASDHMVDGLAQQLDLNKFKKLFFYTLSDPTNVNWTDDVGFYLECLREDQEKLLERVQQKRDQIAKYAPHAVLDTLVEKSNHPARAILDMALQKNPDIIFCGHKGKSNIERFVLGSVSLKLAKYANCSVWVDKMPR